MLVATKRTVNVLLVHQVWDKLSSRRGQVEGYDYFVELLCRSFHVPRPEMADQLSKMLSEGLISLFQIKKGATKKKGKLDKAKIVVMLPNPKKFEKGDHDWYCFRCHKEGEVVQCHRCPRVYHFDCIHETMKPKRNSFVCACCRYIDNKFSMGDGKIRQHVLNKALVGLIERLEGQPDARMEYKKANGINFALGAQRPKSDCWRFRFLVYFRMDWEIMKTKGLRGMYESLEEFQMDVETMIHSYAVYSSSGEDPQFTDMITGVIEEFNKIVPCPECYDRSFKEHQGFWCCLPCSEPHDVVFTPYLNTYWPAKLLKTVGETFYVRFFGDGKLLIIDASDIQTVDENVLEQLRQSRVADIQWNNAYRQYITYAETSKSKIFRRILAPKKKAVRVTVEDQGQERTQPEDILNIATKRLKPDVVEVNENIPVASNVPEPSSSALASDFSTSNTGASSTTPFQYDLFDDDDDGQSAPSRNTEGAFKLIDFLLKYHRTPLCSQCLVDNGRIYCCRSLAFCSTACQRYHSSKKRSAHSCIQDDN